MRGVLLILLVLFIGVGAKGQEMPEERSLKYSVLLQGIKSEEKAKLLEEEIQSIDGIDDAEIEFLKYQLTFETTNLLMRENALMEKLKAVCSKHSVEIQKIEKQKI